MGDINDTIRSLFKNRKISIDNTIFKLHYKITVLLLIICAFLLTSKQYFGEPISCDGDGKVDKSFMDTYCWIYSTFTVKKHLNGVLGKHNVAPGVGNSRVVHVNEKSDEIIKHKYYQWVFVVLFFQALLFYIPHYVWKSLEGGRMQVIIQEFELKKPIGRTSWNDNTKDIIARYLLGNHYIHNIYAARYTVCETLNLVNVVGQVFLLDTFLQGQFKTLGLTVIYLTNADAIMTHMDHIFPKIAKCSYQTFGPSGTIQLVDAICTLPLNIVNEKLYILLWFWLFFLAILNLFQFLYRMITICCTPVRSYLLMAQVKPLNKEQADAITSKLSWGDWFVLYNMNKNMDPKVYEEIVMSVENKISHGGVKYSVSRSKSMV